MNPGTVHCDQDTRNQVPASFNFWGDTYCGFVDEFMGSVDFRPFLNEAMSDTLVACP